MNINFENQVVFLSQVPIDFNSIYLDAKGKMQALEKRFDNLQNKYNSLNAASDRLMMRQTEDAKNFLDYTNRELMESLIINFPTLQGGMIDTVGLFLNGSHLKDNMKITLSGATKDFEISPVKIDFSKIEDIYLADLGKDFPYTFVSLKIDQPKLASSFSIYKNYKDINLVKWKDDYQTWQSYSLEQGFVQYQNITFLDIQTDELTFFVRNTKINDKYYCDLKIIPFYKKYDFTGTNFFWDRGISANSIFATSMVSEIPFYIECKIVIGSREYQVQLPATNNALSRLEVEAYTSNGNNTETIFRCPYPVDFNSPIHLIKDIVNPLEKVELNGWAVSLDKINWKVQENISDLVYDLNHTTKSKFTYFKVSGYYESAYALYKLNKNVNSNWFLTSNEILFFNGSGISINNKSKTPVKISGEVYCFGVSSNDLFPIGILGID
ncbi:MAG: hypothetical protein EB127_02165 [Alphaproteobacteria bacterium]|nr:hypothetical protein [Alphaproteobacteria bacterium]